MRRDTFPTYGSAKAKSIRRTPSIGLQRREKALCTMRIFSPKLQLRIDSMQRVLQPFPQPASKVRFCFQLTICGPKRANLGLRGFLGLDAGLFAHGSENDGV